MVLRFHLVAQTYSCQRCLNVRGIALHEGSLYPCLLTHLHGPLRFVLANSRGQWCSLGWSINKWESGSVGEGVGAL